MANAKISTYLIGMIMFTFFMYGGITLLNSLRAEPEYLIDATKIDSFSAAGEKYDQLNSTLEGLSSGILGAVPDPGIFGVLNSIIQTAWSVMVGLPTLFSFMNAAYIDIANFFGIPVWIPSILLLVLVVIILFTILSAIFQTEV